MKILLLLCFLPLAANAGPFDLTEEELNPDASQVLIKKPEKFLRDESMIYNLNTDLGIKDQRQYTGGDRNRFSMAGHINGGYEHPTDILGLEVNLMRRSTRYNQVWYGAQFFNHQTYFDAISRNSTSGSTHVNSEGQTVRPGNTRNTLMAAGVGAGYRFKLLLDFFHTEDWFETVDVFANYLRLQEKYIGKTYTGYGLTTNYGLHKRSSAAYFYGGKFSYNVAAVTRPAITNESKGDRSLALGWLSFAFELGLFF